jgi:hypothetical protein
MSDSDAMGEPVHSGGCGRTAMDGPRCLMMEKIMTHGMELDEVIVRDPLRRGKKISGASPPSLLAILHLLTTRDRSFQPVQTTKYAEQFSPDPCVSSGIRRRIWSPRARRWHFHRCRARPLAAEDVALRAGQRSRAAAAQAALFHFIILQLKK